MKKLLCVFLTICLCLINVYASDQKDALDEAFQEYLKNPYYQITWLEKEPESIYDLNLRRDYYTSSGNRIFLATPSVMIVFPMISDYTVGNEVFTFNNAGYFPHLLVFDGSKIYHIRDAYDKGILNDWDLREYVLATNFRDASYADLNKKEWYYMVVEECIFHEYMGSTGKQTTYGNLCFEPDTFLSRAMVATILYRMNKNPKVEYHELFNDISSGLWYSNAILWAANKKIISGYENGNFGPDDYITRQDFAIMLRNYAKSTGLDTNAKINLDNFKDYQEVDDYATSAIAWCVKEGLMNGSIQNDGTYLYPKANTTRAECAKMISILHNKINE